MPNGAVGVRIDNYRRLRCAVGRGRRDDGPTAVEVEPGELTAEIGQRQPEKLFAVWGDKDHLPSSNPLLRRPTRTQHHRLIEASMPTPWSGRPG